MKTDPLFLFFITSDAAGCFGAFWYLGTPQNAAKRGFIQSRYTRPLCPALLTYLQAINFHL